MYLNIWHYIVPELLWPAWAKWFGWDILVGLPGTSYTISLSTLHKALRSVVLLPRSWEICIFANGSCIPMRVGGLWIMFRQNQYFNVGLYNMSILNIGVTQHYLRLSLQIVSSFDQRSVTQYSHAAARNVISWCPWLLGIYIFLECGEEQDNFAIWNTKADFSEGK